MMKSTCIWWAALAILQLGAARSVGPAPVGVLVRAPARSLAVDLSPSSTVDSLSRLVAMPSCRVWFSCAGRLLHSRRPLLSQVSQHVRARAKPSPL